jgi:hypothetical protein
MERRLRHPSGEACACDPKNKPSRDIVLQWSVTSPAYDGASKYTCVQPTLVDGGKAVQHAAVPLGMTGSISFK